MRPNKLKRHLEITHPKDVNKPLDFFKKKLQEYQGQQKRFVQTASVSSNAQLASYKVAYRVAQCKKPHTIAEELLLPAAMDMVDEATDSNKDCLLIAYVRYIDGEEISEDLLFCKYVTGRATADELFKIIDTYLSEAAIKWDDCVGVCTDGAQAMAGKRSGLQALIKRAAPNAVWTHCIIHREALASKQLSPELNSVLSDVIATVNLIKTRPLKARIFSALCNDMGAEYTALLFHSESRWLSRGTVLARVIALREEIRIFLEEDGNELASKWIDENFLVKVAYLSDIFEKLNELNLQLQGNNTHLPHLADKIHSFTRKLDMWGRRLEEGNIDSFDNLKTFIEINELQNTAIPVMRDHISGLKTNFQKYFCVDDSAAYDWIRDPFTTAPSTFSSAEEEQYIDLTSDSTARLQLTSKTMAGFWVGVEKDYPLIGQRAVGVLLPFATSHLCEAGFSAVAAIKSKYRSKLDIENELRVAISKQAPRFEKICKEKQAYPSH
ncbi:zinc finger BED domain-containing protein 5-like [Diretmus argenteus]